ncbi:hypothetical protein Z968_10050 [Clostridium novyi A str. 4552]|uniref:TRSP domain C terminus to PRTase_2 n=1 Tax=Clostridium novyi A str. 4552 TaxID=1444289 RepID=A0A0A0I0Z2_CLONO|nr:phosphoribosyltransferase family protein [Clostridium novyi]KGM95094.1 hypothetical protein Z968_10050 [Clostridium novyi A str. 4552]
MNIQYNILDKLSVNIDVYRNDYNLKLKDLFLMAARKNPKRAFLFVSTVLGKHIPVNPQKSMIIGKLLGMLIANELQHNKVDYNISYIVNSIKDDDKLENVLEYINDNKIELKESTLFIGFAETATALGTLVFSQFQGKDIFYMQTTRDEFIECKSDLNFQEEHSHATNHFCYSLKEEILKNYSTIVLVDDEITTGNTALNLIKNINTSYPGKKYIITSILDWRTKKDVEKYKCMRKELNIDIEFICLIRGTVKCTSPSICEKNTKLNSKGNVKLYEITQKFYENGVLVKEHTTGNKNCNCVIRNHYFKLENNREFKRKLSNGELREYTYINLSGRFGISEDNIYEIDKYSENIVKSIGTVDKNTIVLGTEEFMYMPMIIASKIPNAKYQSTTRSPIYPSFEEEYAIKSCNMFKNPFDDEIINYIYNVKKGSYSEVLFITEREISDMSKIELTNIFISLGIEKINFIYF